MIDILRNMADFSNLTYSGYRALTPAILNNVSINAANRYATNNSTLNDIANNRYKKDIIFCVLFNLNQ